MDIRDAVMDATKPNPKRSADFNDQLDRNRQFSDRMEEAGVVVKKQAFTIPLMERIAIQG